MLRLYRHRLPTIVLETALGVKGIHLLDWQSKALWDLPCDSLPPFEEATRAKDASDFARRVGLSRKPNSGDSDGEDPGTPGGRGQT